MPDLGDLLSTKLFMPHGHCYLWRPGILWTQVLSNAAIGLAYMAIAATLFNLVRRVRDIPFQWMYLAFGVFIVTCGITHFFDIVVIWEPSYWIDGAIRTVTAIASVATAFLLPPLVPKAVALADTARLAHERGISLEAANRELAEVLARTRELENLKTQFFANVSHELRTPLALILGPTEKLLADAQLGAEPRRDLEVVARNARTLLKHVNDLLDVSRLEAGKTGVAWTAGDLGVLTRLVAAHFEGLASERQIELRVEGPASVPASFDAPKVQRILLNVLSNAFKFTPSGGQVRCTISSTDDEVLVEVADSGPGIKPEHREVIFERFRQLDEGSARRFGGTGLGLAIARDFAILHGGSIAVAEAPEGGALFTIRLPRAAPAGTELQAPRVD
jgi:signal transduction histidine kinase